MSSNTNCEIILRGKSPSRQRVDQVEKWLGVDEILDTLRQLPPENEFSVLLVFLVEFAGALELAERRAEEMLIEQAAISYKAHAESVDKIKKRLIEIYKAALEGQKGAQYE